MSARLSVKCILFSRILLLLFLQPVICQTLELSQGPNYDGCLDNVSWKSLAPIHGRERIGIGPGSGGGTPLYCETHVNTNDQRIFTVVIGGGG
jgi:hypothetical protein